MKFLIKTFAVTSLILLSLFILCLGGVTVLGFLGSERFGQYAWKLDFLSHFRLQYFLVGLCALPIFLIFLRVQQRFLKWVAIILVIANLGLLVINGSQVIPYYLPKAKAPSVSAKLRIFHLNVYGKNRDSQSVIQEIQASNADIITLEEYNPWWRSTLESSKVFNDYPYRYHVPWGDDGIYSKYPFQKVDAEHVTGSPHGADVSIVAHMVLNKIPVTLLFSHPPTPIKPDLYQRQKLHFEYWAKNRDSYGENFAIIGDLNTTPWSYPFKKLIDATKLRDSQLGFGIQASFPVYDWKRRVPIDHCLVSKNFVVLNRQLGGDVGSDHFPVIIDLGLKNSN